MKHLGRALWAAGLSIAVMASAQAQTAAEESDWTLSANLGVATDYRYRGLMQTNGKPAVQGGFDIGHSSGFYVGNWNSSISWLSDADPDVSSSVEMDFYGGYSRSFANDVTLDVGVLHYYYPGRYPGGFNDPDTTEAYVSVGYGPVSFKYSHAFTDLFGTPDSKHSQYFDLSAAWPTGLYGIELSGHVGRQEIRNWSEGSYTDWSIGLSRQFGRFGASLTYVDTDADRDLYTNSHGRYMGKATVVVGVSAAF